MSERPNRNVAQPFRAVYHRLGSLCHGRGPLVPTYVGILLCGVAAGLLLAVWDSRTGRTSPRTPQGVRDPQSRYIGIGVPISPAPASMPVLASNPADWGGAPLAGTGLTVLDRDPPEALAPPDSVRSSGFRKRLPEGWGPQTREAAFGVPSSDVITYFSRRGSAELEEFYRVEMEQRGFRLISRQRTMSRDGVFLAFAKDRRECTVSLHVGGSEQTRVVVIVGGAGPGGR